jgi:hypothetical protein
VKQAGIQIAIFCSLLYLGVPVCGQAGALRFPESRSYSPGKVWLGWSFAARTGFVRGFIVGHTDGYRSGCRAVDTKSSTASMAQSAVDGCLQQQHLFRKTVSFYQEFITAFYTRYSTDRDVPFRILLGHADEKTPEQVHQWLTVKAD